MPVYFMFCVSFFKKQLYLKNEKYSIVVSLLSRIKYKHYMTWPPTNCNIISFNWFVFIHMWCMSSCEKCSQVQTSVMAFPPLPPMYMCFFFCCPHKWFSTIQNLQTTLVYMKHEFGCSTAHVPILFSEQILHYTSLFHKQILKRENAHSTFKRQSCKFITSVF